MPRGYKGRVVTPVEASKRWRERNPDKVREANRIPRVRTYDPVKNKHWRSSRLKDPEYRLRLNREANNRAKKIKLFLAGYKMSEGCKDCNYKKHHAALEFDHVRGVKLLNVCFAKSISQAKKEIRKCDVVCSNCHRIRTYKRYHEKKG